MLRLQRARLHGLSSGVCSCAKRHIRDDIRADRNHSEQIQDAQNRFVWHRAHIFRPHQHFTYDPASWSRPLEEQSKGAAHSPLAIIERVRTEQQRLDEQRTNRAAVADSTADPSPTPAQDSELPDYFFNDEDAAIGAASAGAATEAADAWSVIPLQQLLDATLAAQTQLTQPRFRGNESLALSNQLRAQLRELLYRIFERLQRAVVDDTITLDALVFAWFVVLASREDLLLAVAEHDTHTEEASARVACAMRRIEHALSATVLAESVVLRMPSLSLDGLVEALHVLTHPSTRLLVTSSQSGEKELHTPTLTPLYMNAVEQLTAEIDRALVVALQAPPALDEMESTGEAVTDAAVALILDPLHVATLADALKHIAALPSSPAGTADGRSCAAFPRVLNSTSRAVLHALRASLPPSQAEEMQRALAKPAARDRAVELRRAVPVDVCAAPRGIRQPRTDPGDVPQLIRAYAAALSTGLATTTSAQLSSMVETVLLLSAHSPNYDLPAVDTLALAHAVLQCLRLSPPLAVATEETTWLRVGLLLSRLDMTRCGRRPEVYTLLVDLCTTQEPSFLSVSGRAEWRRLRGVALHALLSNTTAAFLGSVEASQTVDGAQLAVPWEVAAAFGAASTSGTPTPVMRTLWQEACRERLGGITDLDAPQAAVCAPETAAALVVLRARLADPHRGARTYVVDDVTVRYVAAALDAALAGRPSYDTLLRNEDGAWEEGLERLSESFAVLQDAGALSVLFGEIKQKLQRNQSVSAKVMTFC